MRIYLFFAFLILIDIYTFFGFKNVIGQSGFQKIGKYSYLFFIILSYVGLVFLINYFTKNPVRATLFHNLIIGFTFSFLIFKLLFALFLLVDDFSRIVEFFGRFIIKLFSQKNTLTAYPDRRKFIGQIGLGIASIPFLGMLYGITKGKYNYKVKTIKLAFKNLPSAFNGFKLVHISDIHSGSFDSEEDVQRGIDLVNEQNADVVFFTGDLVNNDAREIEPFIKNFKTIKNKYGLYSSLGNHDYGDYKHWSSAKAKKDNLDLLKQHHKDLGFKLLNNASVEIEKGGEKVDKNDFKILMSHDPTHWDYKVLKHPTNIDLTLSGHTHGMQFGIEIPGFKWSPIKYFYPRWAGLYKQSKQYLYVNRGFGFLGFPGRVGIWPEITVIELSTV